MRFRHPRGQRAGASLLVLGLLTAMVTVLAPGALAEPIIPGNLGGFEIDGNQDEGVGAGGADLDTFDWETVRTDDRITQWALLEDDGKTWLSAGKENDPTEWECADNLNESTPKDDLLRVYLASQITADRQLLHIGYVRDEGVGNTDINIEFNQVSAEFDPCVGDEDGRIRTAGDLLISFTFDGGDDAATIEVFQWDATEDPLATPSIDKNPADGHWDLVTTVFGANGADNSDPEADPIVDLFFDPEGPAGPATLDLRTFGEVTINLASLFDDLLQCPGLGFATVHSRSSHTMSSDLKDVLSEVPFNLSDCGSLKLKKVNELGDPMAGVQFGLYTTDSDSRELAQLPVPPGDDPIYLTCVTETATDSDPPTPGLCTFPRVPAGNYILDEINLPAGYAPDPRLPRPITIEEFQNIDLSDDDLDKCAPELLVGCEWFVNSRLPDVSVVKTTSTGTVNSGDQVTFQIVVSNAGPGVAKVVTFTDNLPDGITWTITPAVPGCAINATTNDLTCSFDTVGVGTGAAVSINVVGTTNRTHCLGLLNPAFSVSANNEPSGAQGNNGTRAVPITVNCPEVTVAKLGNGPVNAGDQAIYTISVTNNGPGTATNVLVSDVLPAGVEWTAGVPFPSPACTIDATDKRTLDCTFASMAPSATQVIRVVGTTDTADCADLNNELVSVTANGAGDDDEDIPIVVTCPDMTVAKVGNADPINAGDPNTKARYTITVDNIGDGAAKNVTFTDVLPAGLHWTAGTPFPAGSTCQIQTDARALTGEHQTLTCTWAVFTADAPPVTIVVEAVTDPADCPGIANPISAVTADNEANTTNNSTALSTITIRCPNLELLKSADATSVSRGNPIGFSIKVWNEGEGVAYGATVSDTLPAGFDWDFVTAGSVLPADATCSVNDANPNVLSCALGNLPAGSSEESPAAVIHVVASGTSTLLAACGPYDNTAAVIANNHPTPASDDASLTIVCPGLNIVKTADNDLVEAGDQVGFTLEVTNTGPGVAMDVVVSDDLGALPGDLAWALDEAGSNLPSGATCGIVSGILTCQLGDLPATTTAPQVTIHLTADTDVPTGAAGIGPCANYPNVASADPSNGDAVRSQTVDVDVRCPLGIELIKAGPALAHVGDTVTYTFTLTNTGYVDLDTEFVDPICDAGSLVLVEDGDGDTRLEIDLDSATAGLQREVWTYTCTRVVQATDPDPLPNTAMVRGTDADGRTVDDTASWVVNLIHPAIQVVKTISDANPAVGQTVTYTYVVTNTGDTTLSKVLVTDDILGVIGTIETLEPGASATLTKTMVVLINSPGRNIGTATGVDTLGKEVTDQDDAVFTLVLGIVVEPAGVAPVAVVPLVVAPLPKAELPRTGFPLQAVAANGLTLMLLGLALQFSRRRNQAT